MYNIIMNSIKGLYPDFPKSESSLIVCSKNKEEIITALKLVEEAFSNIGAEIISGDELSKSIESVSRSISERKEIHSGEDSYDYWTENGNHITYFVGDLNNDNIDSTDKLGIRHIAREGVDANCSIVMFLHYDDSNNPWGGGKLNNQLLQNIMDLSLVLEARDVIKLISQ